MMCTNMTTILSHQEDLGPSMLDVKYEGLGGTGLVTTPLNMAPNLSECNVSHGGIALRLIKLQKRAIRIITDSKYNSHTEPLLKSLNILKINDIFTIQCLKFFHNYINDRVPVFFRSFFVEHALYHDYET